MPDANGQLVPGDPGYIAPPATTPPPAPEPAPTPPPPPETQATPTPPPIIPPVTQPDLLTPTAFVSGKTPTATYTATPYVLPEEAKVQNQVMQIVGENSPLIQQGRARAAQAMNARGLINSSLALGASDEAAYAAALPMAQQNAQQAYGAMTNTVSAQNKAAEFGAGATNESEKTNASLALGAQQAQVAKYQVDAETDSKMKIAFGGFYHDLQMSNADNATKLEVQRQQGITATAIEKIHASTTLTTQEKQIQSDQLLAFAKLKNDVLLSDMDNAAKQQQIAAQTASSEKIAQINADTTLSATDKQIRSNEVLGFARMSNDVLLSNLDAGHKFELQNAALAAQKAIELIHQDTTLTGIQQQNKSDQIIAGIRADTDLAINYNNITNQLAIATMDNDTRVSVTQMQSDSALALKTIDSNTALSIEEKRAQSALAISTLETNSRIAIGTQQVQAQLAVAQIDAGSRAAIQTMVDETNLTLENIRRDTTLTADERNNAAKFALEELDGGIRLQLGEQQANTQLGIATLEAANRREVANISAKAQVDVAKLDTTSRELMNAADNKFRVLLQTNISAADMYRQAAASIATVSTSNIGPGAKNSEILRQVNMLNEGLQAIDSIAGSNLKQYFPTSNASYIGTRAPAETATLPGTTPTTGTNPTTGQTAYIGANGQYYSGEENAIMSFQVPATTNGYNGQLIPPTGAFLGKNGAYYSTQDAADRSQNFNIARITPTYTYNDNTGYNYGRAR